MLAAIALATLIGISSSMGVLMSPTLRDLQLAATLGLDADSVLFHHEQFRTIVANTAEENIPAEYATVSSSNPANQFYFLKFFLIAPDRPQ